MSLAGITQHCKIMYSQSVQAQAGFSSQWLRFSVSLRQRAVAGLGISQSHLKKQEEPSSHTAQPSPGNSAPPAPWLGSSPHPKMRSYTACIHQAGEWLNPYKNLIKEGMNGTWSFLQGAAHLAWDHCTEMELTVLKPWSTFPQGISQTEGSGRREPAEVSCCSSGIWEQLPQCISYHLRLGFMVENPPWFRLAVDYFW